MSNVLKVSKYIPCMSYFSQWRLRALFPKRTHDIYRRVFPEKDEAILLHNELMNRTIEPLYAH